MSRICGLLATSFADVPFDEARLRTAASRLKLHCHRELAFERLGPLAIATLASPAAGRSGSAADRASDPTRQLDLFLDGMLFNRAALTAELAGRGQAPAPSSGDAALALAAYVEWGEDCFRRLSGIFAIVLLDRARGRCLFARDPFGAKPMHHAMLGQHLAFSSQLRPLLDLLPHARLNRRATLEFIMHGDLLPPETFFDGIRIVPPGHVLVVERESPAPRLLRFHDAFAVVEQEEHDRLRQQGAEHFLATLDAELHRSIRENMADGGPHGIALSGGVDSATLTAIAARYGEVHAINVSAPQRASLDERPMATAAAKHVGVPLSIISMTGEQYRDELVETTLAHEMPLWHMQCLSYYLATRRAAELGLKALLCGDTIGMMLSPAGLFPWRNLQPILSLAGMAPQDVQKFGQKLGYALGGLPLNSHAFSWGLPLSVQLVDGYARAQMQQDSEARYAFLKRLVRRRVMGGRLAEVYIQFPRFFHRGDRLGQAWNVEYRTPFGDESALRLAMNLPYEFLDRRGVAKWGIKALGARYLPHRIAFQKKVGWSMPADLYLAPFASPRFLDDGFCAEIFGLTRDVIRTQFGIWQRDFMSLVRLIHMEVWGRLYVRRESAESVHAWLKAFETS